jgi:hypothetical protein
MSTKEDMMEDNKEDISEYKKASTSLAQHLTYGILRVTESIPPLQEQLREDLVDKDVNEQPQILSDRYLWHEGYNFRKDNVLKAAGEKPHQGDMRRVDLNVSENFSIYLKRLKAKTLSRACYLLAAANIYETSEVEKLLDRYAKYGIAGKDLTDRREISLKQRAGTQEVVEEQAIAHVSAACAAMIIADSATYFENHLVDDTHRQSHTDKKTIEALFFTALIRIGRFFDTKVDTLFESNIAENFQKFIVQTSQNQGSVAAYIKENILNSDKIEISEEALEERQKCFDTVSYCFTTGYDLYLQQAPEDLPESVTTALREYVKEFGQLFGRWHQIINDSTEFHEKFMKKGEDAGKDILNGQHTFIIKHLFDNANEEETAYLKSFIGRDTPLSEEEISKIQSLAEKYDCYARVKQYHEEISQEMQDMLKDMKRYSVKVAQRFPGFTAFPDTMLERFAGLSNDLMHSTTDKKLDQLIGKSFFKSGKKINQLIDKEIRTDAVINPTDAMNNYRQLLSDYASGKRLWRDSEGTAAEQTKSLFQQTKQYFESQFGKLVKAHLRAFVEFHRDDPEFLQKSYREFKSFFPKELHSHIEESGLSTNIRNKLKNTMSTKYFQSLKELIDTEQNKGNIDIKELSHLEKGAYQKIDALSKGRGKYNFSENALL